MVVVHPDTDFLEDITGKLREVCLKIFQTYIEFFLVLFFSKHACADEA